MLAELEKAKGRLQKAKVTLTLATETNTAACRAAVKEHTEHVKDLKAQLARSSAEFPSGDEDSEQQSATQSKAPAHSGQSPLTPQSQLQPLSQDSEHATQGSGRGRRAAPAGAAGNVHASKRGRR
jgi:hypothetical protein